MSNSDSATKMLNGRNGVTKDVHIYTCTCDMDLRKEIHIQSPKLCNRKCIYLLPGKDNSIQERYLHVIENREYDGERLQLSLSLSCFSIVVFLSYLCHKKHHVVSFSLCNQ